MSNWNKDMYFLEYKKDELPETFVSRIEDTRIKFNMAKLNADFRTLGDIDTPIQAIPNCLSSEHLQHLIENEHRLKADDDARAFFRYGSWLSDNPENQEYLQQEISEFMPGASPTVFIWYPTGSYMGWHTNANRPGERLFCSYVKEGGKSFFRYRNPRDGKIYTSWDKQGWNFRRFLISEDANNILWHCVYSEVERMSLGFRLPM